MLDRYDITTIRRGMRLIKESDNGLDFSILNAMFFIVMIALVIAGVGSIL